MTNTYKSIKRGLKQAIRHRKRNAGARTGGAKPEESLAEFVRRSPLAGARLDMGRSRNTKDS